MNLIWLQASQQLAINEVNEHGREINGNYVLEETAIHDETDELMSNTTSVHTALLNEGEGFFDLPNAHDSSQEEFLDASLRGMCAKEGRAPVPCS